MPQEWLSTHVHFQGPVYGPACDRVLLDVVEPFIRVCRHRGWASHFFFTRQSKTGSHVRLRLRGDEEALQKRAPAELRTQVRDRLPSELQPGEYGDVPSDHLRWFQYEPEARRYGGERGLEVAEQFFYYSSEAALRFLETCRGKGNAIRLGKGLLAMVALLHSFLDTREQAHSLMRQHKTEYLENFTESVEQKIKLKEHFKKGYNRQRNTFSAYVSETWTRLDGGSSLPSTLDSYYKKLCKLSDVFDKHLNDGKLVWEGETLREDDKGTELIIRTYIHMMNNRLGIPIPKETYLSHLAINALTSVEKYE